MNSLLLLPCLLALLQTPAAPAGAGDIELERALLDAPHVARGDLDQRLEQVVQLLCGPQHYQGELAEAALVLLASDVDELRQPQRWPEALERLRRAPHGPGFAARLARLAGEERVARLELDPAAGRALPECFPGTLAEFRILAPLDGPEPARRGEELLTDPGFEREHVGLRGMPVRWSAGRRSPLRPEIQPAEWVEPVEGWALLAFEYSSATATQAWIEIDTRGSYAQRAVASFLARDRAWRAAIGDPAWLACVNDELPLRVDPLASESAPVVYLPARLRPGSNRILVWCRLDSYPSFALRVRLPSEPGAAAAPRPLEERLPRGTALERALRGAVLVAEQQPIAGLAELAAAAEAAPESTALQALYARALLDSPYLPDVWRRARARALFESGAAREKRLDVELQLARTLVLEDHEEQAIVRLEAARALAPESPRPWLELARVYPRLEMLPAARHAREQALELAPRAASVLELNAAALGSEGQHQRAAELRRRLIASLGAYPGNLHELAGELEAAGQPEPALAALRAAQLRGARPGASMDIARFLFERERWDEADAALAELERSFPRWESPCLRRAAIARRREDARAEERHLREALARAPSSWTAREGLRALHGEEPTDALFRELRADREAVLASYDAGRWSDSVVRVLDSQVLRIFADGGFEALTHDIVQVKDLKGCESEGKQRLDGTVERIVTLHGPERQELEPVEIEGEYVMPGLKPGDYIERVWRNWAAGPEDGRVQLPGWRFASTTEPYHVSRWVVIVPRAIALELQLRNFDGTHEVLERGSDVIHVFETRDRERVVPEPGAPPPSWYLPAVDFGTRPEPEDVRRELFAQARLATRVTPEVRAAAERACAGLSGDEARARALHALVRSTVHERNSASPSSAVSTLLSEQGNPAHLFAALLAAAGIPSELGWSRDVSPESDPEPDGRFEGPQRWTHRLLVRVAPKDGPAAWCDLETRDMPYGRLLGNAPRAQVMTAGGLESLPDLALEQRPGTSLALELEVQDDTSARATLRLLTTGNTGYAGKQRLREVPEKQLKAGFARVFGQLLPGFDLETFESSGLDDESELVLTGHGRVRSFLDQTADGLTARLPVPALSLSKSLTGGEGERRLPYFLGGAIVSVAEVRVTLPPGMRLLEGPPRTQLEFQGGRYELTIDAQDERTFVLRRKLLMAPFVIQKGEYPALARFCNQVDEVERVPLRFAR